MKRSWWVLIVIGLVAAGAALSVVGQEIGTRSICRDCGSLLRSDTKIVLVARWKRQGCKGVETEFAFCDTCGERVVENTTTIALVCEQCRREIRREVKQEKVVRREAWGVAPLTYQWGGKCKRCAYASCIDGYYAAIAHLDPSLARKYLAKAARLDPGNIEHQRLQANLDETVRAEAQPPAPKPQVQQAVASGPCSRCKGIGFVTCATCGGNRWIVRTTGLFTKTSSVRECPECFGAGITYCYLCYKLPEAREDGGR